MLVEDFCQSPCNYPCKQESCDILQIWTESVLLLTLSSIFFFTAFRLAILDWFRYVCVFWMPMTSCAYFLNRMCDPKVEVVGRAWKSGVLNLTSSHSTVTVNLGLKRLAFLSFFLSFFPFLKLAWLSVVFVDVAVVILFVVLFCCFIVDVDVIVCYDVSAVWPDIVGDELVECKRQREKCLHTLLLHLPPGHLCLIGSRQRDTHGKTPPPPSLSLSRSAVLSGIIGYSTCVFSPSCACLVKQVLLSVVPRAPICTCRFGFFTRCSTLSCWSCLFIVYIPHEHLSIYSLICRKIRSSRVLWKSLVVWTPA